MTNIKQFPVLAGLEFTTAEATETILESLPKANEQVKLLDEGGNLLGEVPTTENALDIIFNRGWQEEATYILWITEGKEATLYTPAKD